MANYNYDEGGNMAAYFLITFLVLVLVPVTLSLSPTKKSVNGGCQCAPCVEHRAKVAKLERGTLLNPKFTKKTIFLIVGWSWLGWLLYGAYNATNDNKVYNPFEILGISTSLSEKEIKSVFKQLSKQFHPDKYKPTVNETAEFIQNRFVDITKAYKSLTDETIRSNWEKWGNPDGRQETTMGIAIPRWIVEAQNNIWVLGVYGIIFGGALPALVGRWWFDHRKRTKDGINKYSAAAFFKTLKEESTMEEIVGTFGKAFQWDAENVKESTGADELRTLEKQVKEKAGRRWTVVRDLAGVDGDEEKVKRKSLVLLYAYLLRLPVGRDLEKEQTTILLQSPLLLNALQSVSSSRQWLSPTLSVIRLNAYLAQAVIPATGIGSSRQRFAQLPGITREEVQAGGKLAPQARDIDDFVAALEQSGDQRAEEVKKAAESWGRLDIYDASFKVIGERIITPGSIVFCLVKLRLKPPVKSSGDETVKKELDAEETKKFIKINEDKDNAFISGRTDTEEYNDDTALGGWAHAPYWPRNRKLGWWMLLGDEQKNRIMVAPVRITDVPFVGPDADESRPYRSYKLQFQAPQKVETHQWKLYIVSDTFVGEEATMDMPLKVEDFSALGADEQGAEDEISDPDEDTLAGQMAAMRGGKVKKRTEEDEESDEESSTDDDQKDDESSSDSD